ncbi:PREDICTED: uncharacterized protein LOC108561895 [Nicrophorus vespilloides]|uniref:Uncharacterized protein LOC108561895 n=1 Tax=Nicrophorus vespilloides TaxID=110193 RepID=A0ABM1MLP9_NICVS|nr:PREDICTED: uncharacterized protein LOC108561895 [Nicrophorus vespilloides]
MCVAGPQLPWWKEASGGRSPYHPGGAMRTMEEGQFYVHLGIPTGFRVDTKPSETLERMAEQLEAINSSLLAPWQKLNAVTTFILPQIHFILRGSYVHKGVLKVLGLRIKKLAKQWLNIPQRASPGIMPLQDLVVVATIVQAYRMLTAGDVLVRRIAEGQLRCVVARKIGRANPTDDEVAEYLSGSLERDFARDGDDIRSLWSRARTATRRLNIDHRVVWRHDAVRGELNIHTEGRSRTIISPTSRRLLEGTLKAALRRDYADRLKAKPDQGKVFRASSLWLSSCHFVRTGFATWFCDWRFIHRVRLNCVLLNATRRFRS